MDPSAYYWLAWLLVFFLPPELWAATRTPGRADTFSDFVWRAFGVPRRTGPLSLRAPVPWARARRSVLAAFMGSLSGHFVFGWSAVPLMVFGAGVAAVLVRAVGWERKR